MIMFCYSGQVQIRNILNTIQINLHPLKGTCFHETLYASCGLNYKSNWFSPLPTTNRQFGNVMVLAATCNSPTLNRLVPREKLEHLFNRTIRFLRLHSNISSTLERDADILESIQEVVFTEDDRRVPV